MARTAGGGALLKRVSWRRFAWRERVRSVPGSLAVRRSLPDLRPRVTSRRVGAFQPGSHWPRRPSVATYSRMCSATPSSGLSTISGSCARGCACCGLDTMSSWSMSPPESTGLDSRRSPECDLDSAPRSVDPQLIPRSGRKVSPEVPAPAQREDVRAVGAARGHRHPGLHGVASNAAPIPTSSTSGYSIAGRRD
jgi:hypothetical protein